MIFHSNKYAVAFLALFATANFTQAALRGATAPNRGAIPERIGTARHLRTVTGMQLSTDRSNGRVLSSSFCPEFVPANGSSCSLTGQIQGTCYWSSSAQAGEPSNTNSMACTCNADGTSTFACQAEAFPGGVATPPPTTRPLPDNIGDGSWCPDYAPATGSECPLTGMYFGTCYWSSSAQAGEPINNNGQECTCNHDGSGTFDCKDYAWPSQPSTPTKSPTKSPTTDTTDNDWCPTALPMSGETCNLPTGATRGSCPYRLQTENNQVMNYLCRCTSENPIFSCAFTHA